MQSKTTLRPCPFCGADVRIGTLLHEFGYGILHPKGDCIWNDTDCPYSENFYDTYEECFERWNRRWDVPWKNCANCKKFTQKKMLKYWKCTCSATGWDVEPNQMACLDWEDAR